MRNGQQAVIASMTWESLSFLHWEVERSRLRQLVPPELDIHTFDGRAWIGIVPFVIRHPRPRFLPKGSSPLNFGEVNVRTYVVPSGGGLPGIYMLSLDAQSLLTVLGARALFGLPYHFARIAVRRDDDHVGYAVRRQSDEVGMTLACRLGERIGTAEPGTLAYFLLERYLVYARRGERLLQLALSHAPYVLRRAYVERLDQTLLTANGIATVGEPASVLYAEQVDVRLHRPLFIKTRPELVAPARAVAARLTVVPRMRAAGR